MDSAQDSDLAHCLNIEAKVKKNSDIKPTFDLVNSFFFEKMDPSAHKEII
jgi:hypothetical protein